MRKTLWRASNDDYVDTGYSFAETRAVAEAYLDDPGFGGAQIFRTRISVRPEQVLDWTDMTTRRAARALGIQDPGAIGLDEWLPRTPRALDSLREQGFLWVMLAESFPHDTTTWIWLGTSDDEEPELVRG